MAIQGRRAKLSALAVVALGALLPANLVAQGYTIIHSLVVDDGNAPRTTLVQDAGGFLYGTTIFGPDDGGVFRVEADGDNYTVLHTFTGSDGDNPQGALILGGGFLFGTTGSGGSENFGTIYKVDTNGNNFAVIHHFDPATDGGNSRASLVQGPDTILYGVANTGGANGFGTVFSVDPGGSTYTVIHVFGSTNNDGSHPVGGLVMASDGKLYGTTEDGHNGSGLGTVFRLDTDGDNFETLHTFTGGTDGQSPSAPMIETPAGFLYGTTLEGGSSGGGTVFRLRRDGTEYSVIHAFSDADGTSPRSSLTQVIGGLLYGTATAGGTGGGTIFRMTTAGQLVDSVHDFGGTAGSAPHAGVIQGIDGALYGAASSGGANNRGAIYRLTIPSVLTITPDSGPATGGTPVTITGSGFLNQATVALSGSLATGVSVDDSTTVTATTPNLAPGQLHDLAVTNTDASMGYLQAAWLADFLDVPDADNFHDFVEAIVRAGITAGCGGGNYCRNSPVTRAQMAVFLLKAKHGAFYLPPPCSGDFADVVCPSTFAAWIEQLAAEGITAGCGGDNYCPGNAVTRAQMAPFLLKAKHGSAYLPPDACPPFGDVVCPSTFSAWIAELVAEAITAGCGGGNYCPGLPNTRGQMAVFLTKTFLVSFAP